MNTASVFIIFVTCLTRTVPNAPYDYNVISLNSWLFILSNARRFLCMKGQFKTLKFLIQLTSNFKEYRANTLQFYKQFFTISNRHPWRGFGNGCSIRFKFNTEVVHARKVCVGQDQWKGYRFI